MGSPEGIPMEEFLWSDKAPIDYPELFYLP
jgi:hypothetical protein